MDWEFEWPAQMLMFNTTIEPFGKEHFIGSWPFAKRVITEVYKKERPLVFFYEYFLIDKKKMATRHGNVVPISTLLEILEPEVIRFIYTKRPRMQRNLELSKINNYIEDFDFAEKVYFGKKKARNEKEEEKIKKNYVYAKLLKVPKKMPNKISFRNAVRIVQTQPRSKWKEIAGKTAKADKNVMKRLDLARNWVEKYAPKNLIISNKKV
jgi:lysyl-tRNA synthetase class 1